MSGTSAGYYEISPGCNLVFYTNNATGGNAAFLRYNLAEGSPALNTVGNFHRVIPDATTVELTDGGRFEIRSISVYLAAGTDGEQNAVGMLTRY